MTPLHWRELPADDPAVSAAAPQTGMMAVLANPAFSLFLFGLVAGYVLGRLL